MSADFSTVPDRAIRRQLRQAWAPAEARRLGRAFADLAAAALTGSERGAVRAPDFIRRAQSLLRAPGGPARTPALLRQVAAAGLNVNHPRFMAQQICAPIPMAALVESTVAALNQSLAVWDMSPAGTFIDRDLMDRFEALLGYPAAAEGSLVGGGSYANLTALLAARAALAPKTWKTGASPRMAVLTGAHTHYSISRAAGIMGLGADCVFALPTDARHRTDPAGVEPAMRKARRAGFRNFALVATCGSTSTGSCDDLNAFADLAAAHRAWLHVDAAHGGGFAFSPGLRAKLAGLERADSVAFDPHKMMFMPLSAGAVLARDGKKLRAAFEQHAPYLFSPVVRECGDIGAFTIACSQRFDALKIWLVWKAYGPAFWAALVDQVCATARAAFEYCLESETLEPLHAPESNILCFGLRQPPPRSEKAGRALDARHWELKEAVNASGKAYVSSTVLGGRRALRLVVMNPRSEPRHAAAVLRAVEDIARDGARDGARKTARKGASA